MGNETGKGGKLSPMAVSMQENGGKTILPGVARYPMQMGTLSKENGLATKSMVLEYTPIETEPFTKDTGMTTNKTDKGSNDGPMEVATRVNSKPARNTGKEPTSGRTEATTTALGRRTN